jgi:hypothetical protein
VTFNLLSASRTVRIDGQTIGMGNIYTLRDIAEE